MKIQRRMPVGPSLTAVKGTHQPVGSNGQNRLAFEVRCGASKQIDLVATTKDQTRIVAAETEAVLQRSPNTHCACFVRHVIQIAVLVRIVQIDGRRNRASQHRQNTKRRFHTAGRTQQVTQLTLGTGDRQSVSMTAEDGTDCIGLGNVAQRRAGSVSIDVLDVVRIQRSEASRIAARMA